MFALVSMVFAGVTAVLAKFGLQNISGELAVSVRTGFVFLFTLPFAAFFVQRVEWSLLDRSNFLWLALSALATTLSWIFYYKAIKIADVSTIALIDKGSVVIAMMLAFCFLHEAVTPAKLGGCALIVTGLLVIARG